MGPSSLANDGPTPTEETTIELENVDDEVSYTFDNLNHENYSKDSPGLLGVSLNTDSVNNDKDYFFPEVIMGNIEESSSARLKELEMGDEQIEDFTVKYARELSIEINSQPGDTVVGEEIKSADGADNNYPSALITDKDGNPVENVPVDYTIALADDTSGSEISSSTSTNEHGLVIVENESMSSDGIYDIEFEISSVGNPHNITDDNIARTDEFNVETGQ